MFHRRAAVAGTWYPATAAALAAEVTRHLDAAHRDAGGDVPAAADVVAIVAPHAGLVYSGPVAAYAYQLLPSRAYDTMVIIGPSHYVGFEGASVWPRGAFETPLGELKVDEDLAAAIAGECAVVEDLPEAHAREHSLEMQLPFLAAIARHTPILPIVMGQQTRDTVMELGDAVARAVSGRRALLVASSDLSHFNDARTAAAMDREVAERVERLDVDGLMALIERRPQHACGGGAIVSVLRAATRLGARSGRVLRYADSGDVSGDKSSVVGYMAAAAWR